MKKVNIFYDVRRTWITRLGFLEEKKVEITKGLKVFDHAVAQTDAEIWLKMKEHEASPLNKENPRGPPAGIFLKNAPAVWWPIRLL